MKMLKKLLFLVVVVFLTISLTNCSKNNFSHKYQARSKSGSSTIDPVKGKDAPVRKNYIIPDKRKKVLGQKEPKL